jgi:ribonuclease J
MTISRDLVHASGHPQRDELRQLYKWLQPKALVPMHGEFRHLQEHRNFALDNGIKLSQVVTNGEVMRLLPLDAGRQPLEKVDEAPTGRWYLDGKTVSIYHEEPMRERRKMAFVGVISTAIILASKDGEIEDVNTTLVGIPREVADGRELIDIVDDVVDGTIRSLPRKKRRDGELAAEAVRRAIRAEFYRLWGKKPVTIVHLAYD